MKRTVVRKWLIRAEKGDPTPDRVSTKLLLEESVPNQGNSLSDIAVVYEWIEDETSKDGKIAGQSKNKDWAQVTPIFDAEVVRNLEGKLLTYIEATFTDREQRSAHKQLVRKLVWEVYKDYEEKARNDFKWAEKVAPLEVE